MNEQPTVQTVALKAEHIIVGFRFCPPVPAELVSPNSARLAMRLAPANSVRRLMEATPLRSVETSATDRMAASSGDFIALSPKKLVPALFAGMASIWKIDIHLSGAAAAYRASGLVPWPTSDDSRSAPKSSGI